MCSMNFFEISTAYTLPGATRGANNRVNRPVPAPTSATSRPACSPQAATISSRFWKISRLSPSKFLIDWPTSGLRKRALMSSRFGGSAAGRLSPTSTRAADSSTTCARQPCFARSQAWHVILQGCSKSASEVGCRQLPEPARRCTAEPRREVRNRRSRDIVGTVRGGLTIPRAANAANLGGIPHAIDFGSFNRDPTGSAATRSPLGRG